MRTGSAGHRPPRSPAGAPAPAHGAGAILVVESDAGRPRSALFEQLLADGFRPDLARTAEHARMLSGRRLPRLVVLGGLDSPRGAVELL